MSAFKVTLRDVFRWKGQLTEVIAVNTGMYSVAFKTKKNVKCPHCDGHHEIDEVNDVIVGSPLFENNATPVGTIQHIVYGVDD